MTLDSLKSHRMIGVIQPKNNNNEFFTYNSEKMIKSVPTSELSGNEIKKETAEEFSRTNEIMNQNNFVIFN